MYKSLKSRLIGYAGALLIGLGVYGGGSAMAAEKAPNYPANLIRGTAGEVCVNIPGKAVNRVIGTGIAGYAGLKNGTDLPLVKEIPLVSNLVGLVTGAIGEASKNVTYTVSDTVENAGLTVAGYEGSGPEELGYISAKLDESPLGRTVASAAGGAAVFSIWAEQNGISAAHHHLVESGRELQGAVTGIVISGGSQSINEVEE